MNWNVYLAVSHLLVGSWVVWFGVHIGIIMNQNIQPFTYYLISVLIIAVLVTCYGLYKIKSWGRTLSIALQGLALITFVVISGLLIFHWGFDWEVLLEAYFPIALLSIGIMLLYQPDIIALYSRKENS
jgi:hypothetical protein